MFSPSSYLSLLNKLKGKGYEFRSFHDYDHKRSVILRHDVDFSLEYAEQIVGLEQQMDVTSTFFLLMTTEFYNLLAPRSLAIVNAIKDSGSRIGLHFDPTSYDDIDAGFEIEKATFEQLFSQRLDIVSLHRPRDFLQNNDQRLAGVRHTYEDEYFKRMKYVSDSGGSFRFGSPFDTDEFHNGLTMHINLHPIWWVNDAATPSQAIRRWQADQLRSLNEQARANCLTFDGIPAFNPA